jgi:hypothetical protein
MIKSQLIRSGYQRESPRASAYWLGELGTENLTPDGKTVVIEQELVITT